MTTATPKPRAQGSSLPCPGTTEYPQSCDSAAQVTNWRKRWTALWMQETRQAMAAKGASDDAD